MDISVILMGTYESDENIKKGMAAGAFVYIDKSEAKSNLIPAVEKLFNKSSEHPAGIRFLVVDESKGRSYALLSYSWLLGGPEILKILKVASDIIELSRR